MSLTFTLEQVCTPQLGGGTYPYGAASFLATDGAGTSIAIFPYYEGCDIWRSTNGGVSWTFITTLTPGADYGSGIGYGSGKFFIGGQAGGQGLVTVSSDGGLTWGTTFTDGSAFGLAGGATDGAGNFIFGSLSSYTGSATSVDGLSSLQNYSNLASFSHLVANNDCIWDGTQFVAYGLEEDYIMAYVVPPIIAGGEINWTTAATSSSDVFEAVSPSRPLAYNSSIGHYFRVGYASESPVLYASASIAGLLSSPTAITDIFPSSNQSGLCVYCPSDGLGTIFFTDGAGNVAYSQNGGAAWTTVTTNFLVPGEICSDVIYDPENSAYILIGEQGSISVAVGLLTVPDIVGDTEAAAESAITGAGFTVGTITTAYSSTVPTGDVISQDPAAGASAAPASPVAFVVSLGPPPASISISPTTATVALGASADFTYATVSPVGTSATWSCIHGTISNGVYTAPALPSRFTGDVVTITRDDDGLYAEAVVTWSIPTNPPTPGNPSGMLTGGYRSPLAFPPVMLANVGSINPKVYMPVEDTTVAA